MHSFFIRYKSSRIHYLQGGSGNKLILCFHGYGESAESFTFLEERWGGDFTLLAIDLPFHGKTEWNEGHEGLFFGEEDLLLLVDQIVAGLPAIRGPWSLLGYSMGGRIALSLFEKIPEKVARLALIAPDGLKMNKWYWLATQTNPGNRLFRWTMGRPGWLFLLLRTGHFLRLVNESVYKFTLHYIDDQSAREELYRRWTSMRGFRPDPATLQSVIRERKVPVRILYGRYDRIIRWESGEKFRQGGLASYCQLTVLPQGHRLLQPKNLEEIAALLKD
jgi:pimeloyl-ACP methyl ester carboxylesterase